MSDFGLCHREYETIDFSEAQSRVLSYEILRLTPMHCSLDRFIRNMTRVGGRRESMECSSLKKPCVGFSKAIVSCSIAGFRLRSQFVTCAASSEPWTSDGSLQRFTIVDSRVSNGPEFLSLWRRLTTVSENRALSAKMKLISCVESKTYTRASSAQEEAG